MSTGWSSDTRHRPPAALGAFAAGSWGRNENSNLDRSLAVAAPRWLCPPCGRVPRLSISPLLSATPACSAASERRVLALIRLAASSKPGWICCSAS